MKSEGDWENMTKGMLKAELKRRNISYEELSQRLKAIGVDETLAAITNKISRGRFTAVFLFQVMEAIGCRILRLEE